jgi:hypothetical protein
MDVIEYQGRVFKLQQEAHLSSDSETFEALATSGDSMYRIYWRVGWVDDGEGKACDYSEPLRIVKEF